MSAHRSTWAPAAVIVATAAVHVVNSWDSMVADPDVWFVWLESMSRGPAQAMLRAAVLAAAALILHREVSRYFGRPWLCAGFVAAATLLFPARSSESGFLAYTLVLIAGVRYATRPSAPALGVLVAVPAAVGLVRLPEGLYLTFAALTAVVIAHLHQDRSELRRAVLAYAGAMGAVMLLLPPPGDIHGSAAELGSRIGRELRLNPVAARPIDQMPLVHVRWAPWLSDAERGERERQYELLAPEPDSDPSRRTWRYRWDGIPPGGVRRMFRDPAIEDTQGPSRSARNYGVVRAALFRTSEIVADVTRPLAASNWTASLFVLVPAAAIILLTASVRSRHGERSHSWLLPLPAIVLCTPVLASTLLEAPDAAAARGPAAAAVVFLAAWMFRESATQPPASPALPR